MKGVANVVIPTFTNDLKAVNEKATRHDIRKEIEYGFWGTLLVSEVNITVDEYKQFVETCIDEANGRMHFIHHCGFQDLEENIAAAKNSENAGAELALLAYPPNMYAETEDDIYDYTKAFADATNLGVIIFPVPLWGFERVHPAGFSPNLIRRIVDTIPNVVAIKAEGGMPTIGGFAQCWVEHRDKVVVTFPVEDAAMPLALLTGMPFMGTSDSEYYGPTIPRVMSLIQQGKGSEAMDLWWSIHPARMAHAAVNANLRGANFVHRMQWKYEAWLQGFNGGPSRRPTMRLVDTQMKTLRNGLAASGMETLTQDPDKEFYIGRNPA
jgi:4-hydroxy-tetrahydrodipicolinate synthase